MLRTIPDLLKTLTTLLPTWALVLLAVAIAAVAIPGWLHWMRTKQIKGRVRRMLRADDPAVRQRYEDEAFDLAGGRPRRLVYLADEALRLNQRALFQRALGALDATGAKPDEVRRLRDKVEAKPKRGRHPLEEAVILERMWAQGLHDAARERLAEARGMFPDDDDLAELERVFDVDGTPSGADAAPGDASG